MRAQLNAPIAAIALLASTCFLTASPARAQDAAAVDGFVSAVHAALALVGTDSIPLAKRGEIANAERAMVRVRAAVSRTADATTLARERGATLAGTATAAGPDWLQDDTTYLKNFYGTFLERAIQARTDPESRRIGEAVQAFRHAQLLVSYERSLERLHRYELKFGPGSAKLNALEVLENFVLQRAPLFRPTADGPSPWEFVSGYSTSYVTVVDGDASAMSVVEVGLRHYQFSYDPVVKSGLRSYLAPRYWTAGLAVGAEKDGGLRWPLHGTPRLGAFATYGELKVAYLGGGHDRWRWLVSRQFQLLPHVL